MVKFVHMVFLALLLGVFGLAAYAQDSAPVEDDDDSSERVEQREDSYRRQMELEDARARDRTYVDSTYGGQAPAELEKIDKLPEESRDNIRDQLVDVIMENGEWEPKDALEDYPYQPTATAQSDPELKQQEQEAWDEQVEKYHEREAAAFGAHRGPVPGPGNPTGQQGGQQGDGSEQGQQGGQQGSGQGGQDGSGSGSRGTYQPYESSSQGSEDEVSTAGVSESALDFLRGQQGQQQQSPETQAREAQEQAAEAQQAQADASQDNTEQAQAEQQQDPAQEAPLDTRGIIAIKDLDKLEGTEIPADPDDSENP